MVTITPLPMRLAPDWVKVAELARESGPVYLPANIPAETGRVSLHRLGVALRPVREAGLVVSYCASVKPLNDSQAPNDSRS